MKNKTKHILKELKSHIPYTALSTIIAIFIVVYIQYIIKKDISENAFHAMHLVHIFASAMVTTVIFYKYSKSPRKGILIGITGAIIIGSLSDILMPFLGGKLFSLNPLFHLPLIEMPILVITTAVLGGLTGVFTKVSKFPHFIHVFLSVFASLFYLLIYSQTFNTTYFVSAFFIVFISVIIPCCVSDIIFPFLFLKNK